MKNRYQIRKTRAMLGDRYDRAMGCAENITDATAKEDAEKRATDEYREDMAKTGSRWAILEIKAISKG